MYFNKIAIVAVAVVSTTATVSALPVKESVPSEAELSARTPLATQQDIYERADLPAGAPSKGYTMKNFLAAAAGGIGGSALYQTVIKPYLDGMNPRDLEASLSPELMAVLRDLDESSLSSSPEKRRLFSSMTKENKMIAEGGLFMTAIAAASGLGLWAGSKEAQDAMEQEALRRDESYLPAAARDVDNSDLLG